MTDTVLYHVADRVATITLNRPDRLNAFSLEMRSGLADLLTRADDDDEVAVIVVTGAGRGFCAGADRDDLTRVDGGVITEGSGSGGPAGPGRLLDVRKPTIAVVNGPCAGLGLCLALLCDVRFVAADAKVTTSFARLGLPAESGSAWLLPRLVGTARALDLLWSSRVIDGTEARALGLAQFVHPAGTVLDEGLAYARHLASLSPWSLATMKEQVYRDGHATLRESYARAVTTTAEAVDRPEFKERLATRPRG